MISKRCAVVVIFILMVSFTMPPRVRALPETQTIHITSTGDDGFVLQTGTGVSTQFLVTVLDPGQDIQAWLVFRQIEVNGFESLQNATLRLRTASSLSEDPVSSVTIYGVKDGEFPGFANAAQVLSAPLTSAHVDVNTSAFSGSTWKEIDVSSIVEEMKSQPSWEGDGVDGFAIPGTFGFIIFGAEGHDSRYFYDLSAGNGYEAQLVIHWGAIPDEPAPGDKPPGVNGTDQIWDYENTTIVYIPGTNDTDTFTGEIDIFKVTDYGDPEILVVDSDDLNYFNTTKGDPNYVNWAGTTFDLQESGAVEFITSLDGWTFLVGQNGTGLYVYYSDDEFTTWRTDRVNSHYPLATGSNYGSIWADQNGTALIHLVWSTYSAWNPAKYDIVYTNFTLDPNTLNLIWSPTHFNVTASYPDHQTEPDMYQEKDGTIHVTWSGKNGTAEAVQQYRRRQSNGTWLNAVRLSTDTAFQNFGGDVIAHEDTGTALIVWTQVQVGNYRLLWDVVFPNNTAGTLIGTSDRALTNARYVSMVNYRENNTAHLVYCDDAGDHIEYRNRPIDNVTAWSASQVVSSLVDRHFYPSISVDEINDTLAVIWWDLDAGDTMHNYFQISTGPTGGDLLLLNHPLRYPSNADYYSRTALNVTWWAVWPNGTVLTGGFDSLDDLLVDLDDLLGVNPLDPNPPSQDWDPTGPFTRFNVRFYIWMIGVIMVWGPVMYWAYQRPSGYVFAIGCFVIMVGFAFMIAAGSV